MPRGTLVTQWLWSALLGLVFLWALSGPAEDLPRIIVGLPNIFDYVVSMFPPNLNILPELVGPMIETIQIAIVAIVLAAAVSVPLSFLAARNVAPNLLVYTGVRGVTNTLRIIPTMIWASLFVAMVGLGPLAGVFALTCHCIGTLSKFFSESVEAIGPEVVDALDAMRVDGANELRVILYGLLPAVFPLFLSYILYFFEYNIRVGTVLGLVGAGGIGLRLNMTIRLFKRQETLTILLFILFVVMIVDRISWMIRKRFMV